MKKAFYDHIIHGGDYNPDQWINTPKIWDEDMRLMKLAHINSATVNIFAWSLLEPEEGVYHFEWLDTIMDKLHENGMTAILSTPSASKPAWMGLKYPETMRVNADGVRAEYGERANHCMTSPIYRQKVREINRLLAERYKDHPALSMWHISNEYGGFCHCELCQEAFRNWLKERYHNDLDELNDKWWSGFWGHRYSDWSQIASPKPHGEGSVTAMKLNWRRFTSDNHISFYENEIAPLREITPHIPITNNLMRMFPDIDYQKFAKHLDLVSWDNYPAWNIDPTDYVAMETAFNHDTFRSLKGGQPFFMMESTPSLVNWREINKLPPAEMQELSAIQAVAHGADSVQYFQWRKCRGGFEKYHGAVVDHCGHENTRVFRGVAKTGQVLEKLSEVVGAYSNAKVAVIYDWENEWATNLFNGYNNIKRKYLAECIKWYEPFYSRGITTDIISMEDDFSKYDLIVAPFLYMLKDGTIERIEAYVKNGGHFAATTLTGLVDDDDRCHLGGFPAGVLKDVFGIWCEETDSFPEGTKNTVTYGDATYDAVEMCDLLHANTADVLAAYQEDFYAGTPALTENAYGDGKAYYIAFRNDADFAYDFGAYLIEQAKIQPDAAIIAKRGVSIRKRGELLFVMNFTDQETAVTLDRAYTNVLTGETMEGSVSLAICGYLVLK